jgi:hypothetical protein
VEIDLIEKIKEFSPNEMYALTYSIDLQYYESYVLPLLSQVGCTKNVVFSDGDRTSESIESDLPYLNKIGKEYFLIPIQAGYAFHPKVYLFKKVRKDYSPLLCLIGSGNLTYPGFNTNKELFVDIEWDGKRKASGFWRDILNYFLLILNSRQGESIALIKKWFLSRYPTEFETGFKEEVTLIRFPDTESVFSRFLSKIGSVPIKKVFISAPFFDQDLSAANEIIKQGKPKEVEILIQVGKTLIAPEGLHSLLKNKSKVMIRAFTPIKDPSRYLHAKLIVATTSQREHVLAGSANISDVALFGKGKAFNYEACAFMETDLNKSILRRLDIVSNSSPIKINDIPRGKITLPTLRKRLQSLKIISVECFNGRYLLEVPGSNEISSINIQVLFKDGRTLVKSLNQKSSDDVFYCNERDLMDVVSIRIYGENGVCSNWIPVLFVAEIAKSAKRYFSKAENIKLPFFSASGELEKDYYLELIIDELINESLQSLKREGTERHQNNARGEAIQGRANITIEPGLQRKERKDETDDNIGFAEGIEYVISALRERINRGRIETELPSEENEGEFGDYDQKAGEKAERSGIIDNWHQISKRLKNRRKVYLQNSSIRDPVVRLAFFSLVALPHLPKLHRYYYDESKTRCPCVEESDWEDFLVGSTEFLGSIIFKSPGKAVWPELHIEPLKKEIFEVCLSSFLYSISTIFPFLEDRGIEFLDEGYQYCQILNQLMTVTTALFHNYLALSGATEDSLKERLHEISEHFPCSWFHVKRSLDNLFYKAKGWMQHDFRKSMIKEFGKLEWISDEGFIFTIKGIPTKLWC